MPGLAAVEKDPMKRKETFLQVFSGESLDKVRIYKESQQVSESQQGKKLTSCTTNQAAK